MCTLLLIVTCTIVTSEVQAVPQRTLVAARRVSCSLRFYYTQEEPVLCSFVALRGLLTYSCYSLFSSVQVIQSRVTWYGIGDSSYCLYSSCFFLTAAYPVHLIIINKNPCKIAFLSFFYKSYAQKRNPPSFGKTNLYL